MFWLIGASNDRDTALGRPNRTERGGGVQLQGAQGLRGRCLVLESWQSEALNNELFDIYIYIEIAIAKNHC